MRRKSLAKKVALGSVAVAPLTGPLAPGTILTGLAASAYVASRKVRLPEVNWETSLVSKRFRKELEEMSERCLELARGGEP